MNAQKLLRIARTLDRLTPAERKQFDMDLWIGDRDCGTVGCAIGTCAIKGQFESIRLGQQGGESALVDENGDPLIWISRAVGRELEITHEEVVFLFLPKAYRPFEHDREEDPCEPIAPGEVARRIRGFVRHGGLPKSLVYRLGEV